MYKISEFSKITQLTIKALRYYDEQNLLNPSYRAENGYRYYNDTDYQRAQIIVLLRTLDFSISEVKDVLLNCDDPDDLSYFLSEKQKMVRDRIKEQEKLIKNIGTYLGQKNAEADQNMYKIDSKIIPEMIVSSIRYQGKYSDMGQYVGTLFKEVKDKAAGTVFNLYHDPDFKEEADIEICIPTKISVAGKVSKSKKIPEAKVIYTTHKGGYDSLNSAYKALLDYAYANKLECLVPSREIYLKGPGMIFKGNPNKYVTEICIPYKEMQEMM